MNIRPTTNPETIAQGVVTGDPGSLTSVRSHMVAPPFKVRKILVPVDFSGCSMKALSYAVPLAREAGATLELLHVVPPYYTLDPYGIAGYEAIEQELVHTAEQKLAEIVLDKIPQQVKAEIYVRNGRPSHEIVAAAKELDADFIVISTHGRTGLKHAFIGSTAENVVRHAPCPVLTLREQEHEFINE